MAIHQVKFGSNDSENENESYCESLYGLLAQDLDFHGQNSAYASHNFHAFPAKFPPQLPHRFIERLTSPGDTVLDPMMGSGTTVLEAYLMGRCGLGFDIDPLALLLGKSKVTAIDSREVLQVVKKVLQRARGAAKEGGTALMDRFATRWTSKTRDFLANWFAYDTQVELLALITEIEDISDPDIRAFCKLAFSATIITKSGGLSLALDLAHTRPHRARIVFDPAGRMIEGIELADNLSSRNRLHTKRLRSPFEEFEKKIHQNLGGLPIRSAERTQPYLTGLFGPDPDRIPPRISMGDAQALPIDSHSVDLIVTSPPYASNAIDYMRAHKFSLVWLGYEIDELGARRKDYIGGESTSRFQFEPLPKHTQSIVAEISRRDAKKGRVLHRYYSEMTRSLREMFRVLKGGRSAIVVVGSSIMRGRDTETQTCLAEIGATIGFQIPHIGVRKLDRNRRMMPARTRPDLESQIEKRMHEEYIIGFYKPLY